ncbi:MAG: CBS domain-containing protein [Anaerovoracaceae bacterium]|jgi:CBS domain-containing protein
MKVKDLMSNSIICARPETSIEQVAKQMRQADVGSIPICDDQDKVLGIITDRDIVVRALSSDENNKNAEDIMTQHPISATPNMDIHQAALLMAKNQIRRLPVVDNNRLIGYLSMADYARKSIYVDEAGDALSAISKPSTLN